MSDGCTLGLCITLFPVIRRFDDIFDESRFTVSLSFDGDTALGDINDEISVEAIIN